MAGRRITIEIAGDAAGARKAFGQADKAAKGFEGSISGVAKGVAKSVGSAFALEKVVQWGAGFVGAAEESQKVSAQTEAVIKSMGGAAGVTADEVAELSEALSAKTGVDDELIQSGQNVLMTFGQLRNEAGKGNDVFDQATKAALDMSVALGQDLSSASMMVGKALNDPVRGLTALRRSGIQFTEEQQEQIKAMAGVGDVAGAQKIMLEELERQFGGSAEAQATATDKMRVAWGNLQEDIGGKLLPIVETAAGALEGMLSGGAGDAAATAAAVGLGIGGIAAAAGAVIGPIQTARGALEGMGVTGAALNQKLGALGRTVGKGGLLLVGFAALDELVGRIVPADAPANLDKLTNSLLDFGQTATVSGELADAMGDDLGGLADAFSKVLEPGNVERASNIADEMLTLGGTFDSLGTGRLENARQKIDDIDKALADLHGTNPELARQAMDQLTTAMGAQGLSADQVSSVLDDYESALASTDTQNRATKESIDQTVQAMQDQADALTAQFSPLFGMVDAMVGQRDAQTGVAEAQQAINDAVDEFGAGAPEVTAAELAYNDALTAGSKSMVDAQQAMFALNGSIAAGDTNLEEARQSLWNWAIGAGYTAEQAAVMTGQLDGATASAQWLDAQNPTVPLTATDNYSWPLNDFQQRLNALPSHKRVTIEAILTSSTFGLYQGLGGNAAGGEAEAGVPGWVGEAGKEIWIPEVDGRVLSHADSMRAISAGAGGGEAAGGGGGDTYVSIDMRGAIIAGESQFRQMVQSATNDLLAAGGLHVRGRRIE